MTKHEKIEIDDPRYSLIFGEASTQAPPGAVGRFLPGGKLVLTKGRPLVYRADGSWIHEEGDPPVLDVRV